MDKKMMKAFVVDNPGGVDALKLKEIPIPTSKPGWVVIKIKAFGLNRTEMFARIGKAPNTKFPIVPGIECVGVVEDPSDSGLANGQKVAAIHPGHMGFYYNGTYAEYVLTPVTSVFPVDTSLDWATFGALPEMFQTVWGSLTAGLEVKSKQSILIRGGTSSIGMTAARLAKSLGLTVLSTTRNPEKSDILKENGVDHVIIDDGELEDKVHEHYPEGVDRILEIIGPETLLDSLKCAKKGGIVCMVGMLGAKWTIENFSPFGTIPHCVKLTAYYGAARDMVPEKFQEYVSDIEAGRQKVNISKVFPLPEVPDAHQLIEENKAGGKLVVLVDEE